MALACLTDHVSVHAKKNFNAYRLSLKLGSQRDSLFGTPLQNSLREQGGCQRHGIPQALFSQTGAELLEARGQLTGLPPVGANGRLAFFAVDC
jgi:hypothetical protein